MSVLSVNFTIESKIVIYFFGQGGKLEEKTKNERTIMQKFCLDRERNVTLTAMVQPLDPEVPYVRKRPAILILPGGGYQYCSEREAEPVAYPYLAAGYSAFVLRYSVMEHSAWPNPLRDYERAMEFILEHAEEWNILPDKIAVIGFSAGGHLAAMAAAAAKHKPAAAILCYPAAKKSFWDPYLLPGMPEIPDAPAAADQHTCPCFVFATRSDGMVPVGNSLDFVKALEKYGVSFEIHIYSYGPHGLVFGNSALQSPSAAFTPRVRHWVSESIGWLRETLGDFSEEGFGAPTCPARVHADFDEYLSADCTVGFLHSLPAAEEAVAPVFRLAEKALAEDTSIFLVRKVPIMYDLFAPFTLRSFAQMLGIPAAETERADALLGKIKNPKL